MNRYTPVALLVVERATPVAMFVALIWALGMTAPLGSFTIPVSCASKVWARSPESKNVMAAIRKQDAEQSARNGLATRQTP